MKVAVGSENPVKIATTKAAFEMVFPDYSFTVVGVHVGSGVSDQPMSDRESIKGATNRAQKALNALQADYGVGLEGGLHKVGNHWFDTGWVVVLNAHNEMGIGSTVRLALPESWLQLIRSGKELGEVNDMAFNLKNSKQAQGNFGLLTNNKITRTRGLTDGVIAALSRFLHPELF